MKNGKNRTKLANQVSKQKANGESGRFGHLHREESTETLEMSGGSVKHKFAEAAQEVFGGAWNNIDEPEYSQDLASVSVRLPFGGWARIGYGFDDQKFAGYFEDETPISEKDCEKLLERVTIGKDGTTRTPLEALTRFRDLVQEKAKKPAKSKASAKPKVKENVPATRGYTVPEDRRRYLDPQDIQDLESGVLPIGTDERIANGEVFDKVYDAELGTMFYRADPDKGVYPISDSYTMRFQTSRNISEEERSHISKLVGACWVLSGRSEGCSWPEQAGTDNSFTIYADSTKSSGYPPAKVVSYLGQYMAEGTPPRPSKGNTRWAEAFPDPDLKVEIYFNSPVS